MPNARVFVRMVKSVVPATLIGAGLSALAGFGLSGCAQGVSSQAPVAQAAPFGVNPNGVTDPNLPVEPPPPPPPRTFPEGTRVAGVEVGGQTEQAAGHAVRLALRPAAASKLTLRYGTHAFPRTWAEVGAAPDTKSMLESAWTTPEVPLVVTVDLATAKRSIRRAARALDIPSVAPRFTGAPGASAVKEGRSGRKVAVHESAMRLKEALEKDPETKSSPLIVVEDTPDFTAADLRQIKRVVVSFSTRFNPGERSRTHNLRLVAKRLNGALIRPGQVFSFNDWVGERKPSEGFQEAIVYKQGKMVKDTAGGLCQVSSTLYNVALLAGLPIVERSNHSLTVHYVPLGRDATVYWGQRDLRFRNDTDMPLYIHTATGRNTLTIEAWGSDPLARRVRVTSSAAYRGDKAFARVIRTVVENGTRKRETISSDSYSTEHTMASSGSRRSSRADRSSR